MEEIESIFIKLFYSYARTETDKPLRNNLEKHLANLKWQGSIADWSDQNINAGEEWEHKVNSNLEEADIILLLISPDFMHSDYCYSIELKKALEKHKAKNAEVIPIILRPVDWENSLFSHLKPLPKDGEPITTWKDQDAAFLDVVQGIKIILKKMLVQKYLLKTQVYISNKQLKEALACCDSAIAIDTTVSEIFLTKGNILHIYLNRNTDAIIAYNRAIKLKPANATYHEKLGDVLYHINRHSEALVAYEKAKSFDPNNAVYYEKVGNILHRQNRKREALYYYSRASELDFSNAYYHEKVGDILYSLKHSEEALVAYGRAIDLNPSNAYYHEKVGDILYFHSNHEEEAVVAYGEMIKLLSDNASYYEKIGDVLYYLKKDEEALAAYNRASELDSTNPGYLKKQASVFERWAYTLRHNAKQLELRNTTRL